MDNSESDKENEIIVKINITENETLLITQEIELKTEEQIRIYEKIIRELQNFVTDIIYENYEERLEKGMSGMTIMKTLKNHNDDNIRNDNDIVMGNNESNNIENMEEQRNDEYNNDNNIENNDNEGDNDESSNVESTTSQRNNDTNIGNDKENIEDQENYDNDIENIMDQENNDDWENNNSMENDGSNNFESINEENIMDNKNMITEVNDNIRNIENQENDGNMGNDNTENIENSENNYDNNNRSIENQEIDNDNANIGNTDKNQNNESIMETNNDINDEVIRMDANQDLRINFENGNGKEKIIDKTKNNWIYQERKIKDKEKLDNLIKELTTEGSNVLEEGINEKSEDIIRLFRKMERNKLKQIINGYQFAKMVIKERKELYENGNESEVAEKVNKKIWKGMPGYSYLTIRRKTGQAIKVYEMFSKIGGRKRIMRIKEFTWSYISRLNEEERQYVINGVKTMEKGR